MNPSTSVGSFSPSSSFVPIQIRSRISPSSFRFVNLQASDSFSDFTFSSYSFNLQLQSSKYRFHEDEALQLLLSDSTFDSNRSMMSMFVILHVIGVVYIL
ncbi:hypothetical protein QL285_093204 [Trifolium repens]|nr:hypothetical protein QL285_093204 [Trifolium repens]